MSNTKTRSRRIFPALMLAGLLAGCAAGTDFMPPSAPDVTSYTVTPLTIATTGPASQEESQRFIEGARVSSKWWQELGSVRLNALIDEALMSSPTLAAANATLRQAQEVYAARAGSTLYPLADANLGGQRQRTNPIALGQIGDTREYSLYNAGVGLRYTLDLAGGNRRALEALAARVEYQQYQLEGARLALTAKITTAAITRAGVAMQIKVTENILQSQTEQMGVFRERVRLGRTAIFDILPLEAQVEETRAGIPLLRNILQQNEHMLAVLAGRPPGAGTLPSFSLEEFTLPADLPLVVPSELIRARPDIRAAEALLHESNAEYGVAIARLYPQLNLSANMSSQAMTIGALFGSGSMVWSLVGELLQPLFNPGLPAEKRAALAAFGAAAANYQNVVLESLRNVADLLRALENDAQRISALSAAYDASRKSLKSVQRRYALGAVGYFEVLSAQQRSQQIRISLIETQTQRLIDSAAFFQAVGGGVLNDNNDVIAAE